MLRGACGWEKWCRAHYTRMIRCKEEECRAENVVHTAPENRPRLAPPTVTNAPAVRFRCDAPVGAPIFANWKCENGRRFAILILPRMLILLHKTRRHIRDSLYIVRAYTQDPTTTPHSARPRKTAHSTKIHKRRRVRLRRIGALQSGYSLVNLNTLLSPSTILIRRSTIRCSPQYPVLFLSRTW